MAPGAEDFEEKPRSFFPGVRKHLARVPVPPVKPIQDPRENPAGAVELCRALLTDCLGLKPYDGLDELLAAAAEFAPPSDHRGHAVVGLVHFCHYLLFTERLSARQRKSALTWVKASVVAAASRVASRRYEELLQPFEVGPRER
jgi:hypothetical protein